MNRLRAVWRLLRTWLHGVHGLLWAVLRCPQLDLPARHRFIGWWAAEVLRKMGLRLVVEGGFRPGAKLVVANHVSWIDIMAINAACPEARFVSKADVQRWPLINRLVAAGGTLFIERERPRDAMRVVHQMAEAMQAGDTVAVFPEGTTGDGVTLLPFHANLLQAAIATATPVQPVALRFSDARHANSPAVVFLGKTTLLQSMWRLACAQGLQVRLRVLPAQGTAHADRRALAERLRGLIAEALVD